MSTAAFDFSGKSVFIAGGTSGINLGIAQAFARSGARVAVLSRSADKVAAAVAALKTHGGEVFGYSADVRDYAAVEAALQAFPYLNKPGASIVNISAPQAFLPMEFQMHVCAAKAGVDMITRVGAQEWGAAGVRVNSVCPGPIDNTEGMRRLAPTEAARQVVTDSVPLGRFGHVDDIANACLWLASPLAGYVSGAVNPVDGGWSLGGATSSMNAMKKEFIAAAKPKAA
jgi:NAD(P)-dependent dehydrogenase (short-subunit alcohol dehydrogenase family)